jgi:hypothetical protein
MNCANCGTTVTEEQRFCRQCGLPVAAGDSLISAPNPAKVTSPSSSPQQNAGNVTSPDRMSNLPITSETKVFSNRDTNLNQRAEFRGSKSTNPTNKSAPAVIYDTMPPESKPAAHFNTKSLERKLAYPTKNLLLIGGGVVLLLIIAFTLFFSRSNESAKPKASVPSKPATPEIPTSAESFLPEDTAYVNDEETVVTATFPLNSSAKFSLANLSGNVTIEGTDDMNASVKVIKKGGSVGDRKEVKIGYSTLGGNLTLKSPQLIPPNIDIAYEIKLPRNLGQARVDVVSSKVKLTDIDALVEIKTVSGAVDLTKIKGAVTANTQSGDITLSQASGDLNIASASGKIELNDVSGATIKTNNVQGNTRAIIGSAATSADALSFESVSGDIDIKFKSEINAELDAGTVSGTIDVQGLGIAVKKVPGSATATGRVGIGGQPLKIKTTSGNIKVAKKS